jgi:hypothetical protein
VFQVPEFNPDPNDESAASKMLVVQQYIAKPMLINNFKFDLRIYVAVTSCVPHMRAFIHREGLTRFCTTPYEAPTNKNIDCSFMHLTNYAVNKKNQDFEQPSMGRGSGGGDDGGSESGEESNGEESHGEESNGEDDQKRGNKCATPEDDGIDESKSAASSNHGPVYDFSDLPAMADISPEEAHELLHAQRGSKWSVTAMFAWLAERGHDTHKIWNKMQEVIALTLLPIMNVLQHRYRASFSSKDDGFGCFELLGFDIMLDHRCVPILIEVNHSPSFETSSPLDDVIKTTVIRDTLRLAGIDADTLMKNAKRDSILKTKGSWIAANKVSPPTTTTTPKEVENNNNTNMNNLNRQTSFGSRRSKNSNGTATGGNSTNETRGPQMPMRTKNIRGRRSENETQFLERLRTVYEDEHCGGFERIVPLPPDIDIKTANSAVLQKKYELYQQVSCWEWSFVVCCLLLLFCW